MRLRSFLSRQSTPRLLSWVLRGCVISCAAGLILSGWGVTQAYKSFGRTKQALANEKADTAQTERDLAKKPPSLFRDLPRDASLGQDQYLASFIEELGLVSDESGCTVISVQSGTVTMEAAPTPTPGMEPGTAEGALQGAEQAAEAARAAQESTQAAAQATEQGGMAAGSAQPPPSPGGSAAPEQAQGASGWEEIRLEASLRGEYFGALRLLDALSHSGKVCSVNGFELSRSTIDPATGGAKVQLKLFISIFRKA